jgi:threonyl-tRNA synthetase
MGVDILKDFTAGIAKEETEDLLKLISAFKTEQSNAQSGLPPERLQELMTILDRRLTQIAKRLQRLDAKMKFFQEIIPLLFKKSVIMNDHINAIEEVTKKPIKLKPGSRI